MKPIKLIDTMLIFSICEDQDASVDDLPNSRKLASRRPMGIGERLLGVKQHFMNAVSPAIVVHGGLLQ